MNQDFELKTYGELEEHLLATMDSFTDQMCKGNSGMSKEQYWNICLGATMNKEKSLPLPRIMSDNVLREFPEYTRCDYKFDQPAS
jgi:hypothetical protein